MPTFTMRVIPEPAPNTRAVLMPEKAPIMKGTGDTNHVCGGCRAVLLESLSPEIQLVGLVYRCPQCGAHNEL